ncbi:hypothetical protein DL764_009207 [Monosporascus ibericus]|uniref:TEA domain-containing protein n=1 Tax=Monosporascus ibericus TaxID=155417 RepID=A0A4V1X917_9PEZI|nr:hypothetical protein DL764_009207 [Monosporascus ibericus]
MLRRRKQVSSHIQVLKGFFYTLPTCVNPQHRRMRLQMLTVMQVHFIFPGKKDPSEDDRKLIRGDEDIETFKNNRVLLSIADGRLPDERPNYDYFARLLSADNDIFLRPKQCWIFVSSSKVTLKEKHVTAEDGTTRKQISGYDPDGRRVVGEADYPHLRLNEDKDYKNMRLNEDRPGILLHEYTRALTQKESCCVKEISNKWCDRFPELAEKLGAALRGARASDERTSRCVLGPCDTFHFEVVLDLHSKQFPSGSELNGVVELSISRPDLQNHRWRTVTTVVKPESLYLDDSEPDYHDRDSPVDVIASHRAGCTAAAQRGAGGGGGVCDCAVRGSRDTLSVRFPASSWANTLFRLAPFVSAMREEREREREKANKDQRERPGGASRPRVKQEEANNRNASSSSHRPSSSSPQSSSHQKRFPAPSGTKKKELMDLLQGVAMYQEIWSAPNDSIANRGGGEVKRSNWTRRAVLLWTFVPAHENTDNKGKTTVVPAGTNWRFMSKLDPTSQYHQQRAYLSGPPSVTRDAVMSPNPAYAHHVHAAMHEHFGAAAATPYDQQQSSSSSTGMCIPTTAAAALSGCTTAAAGGGPGSHLAGLNLLDAAGYVDVDGGLAAPPPTASLQGNAFGHSFDGGAAMVGVGGGGNYHHHHHPPHNNHHSMSFMSDGTTTTGSESHSQQQHLSGLLVGLGVGGDPHTAADPFFSGLGGAARGYEDAGPVDCDANLQVWAQGGIQGLADASQWATAAGSYGGDGHHHHHHHHPVTSSWTDARDLTPAAMAELRDAAAAVQWGPASPLHHWASGGDDKDAAGAAAAAALWSSPPPPHSSSNNDNNSGDHLKPHEEQQQQQQQSGVTDQDHQDAWTAWQAVEAAGRQQSWGDEEHHGGATPTATTAVADSHHDGGFSLGTTGLTPMRGSRKRSRAESLDDDDDGGARDEQESYRVSSMRKLTHHDGSDGGGAAPTAVMGDEYQL